MIESTQLNTSTSYSQTSNSTSNSDMGKAEFLEMLVAQLQNQDPLSPMENQDFAAQLAQFSSLEQLSQINTSLESGMEVDMLLTNSVNNTLATNFIGKQISSYGDNISLLSGESRSVNFILQDYAEKVEINIYDAAGNLVRTIEAAGLDGGNQSLSWDGKNDQDAELPGGNYRFEITAKDSSDSDIGVVTVTKGIVSSVRYANGQAILMVNGKEISLSDVLEIG